MARKPKSIDRCLLCGLPRAEHHRFTPIRSPIGCTCDPMEWGDPGNIPDVCDKYIPPPEGSMGVCQTCEHDLACHKEAADAQP